MDPSSDEFPAVLTVLATREGTSITVIDNVRDGFEAGRTWGQRLFFNQNGERASLTGQRKSEFLAERQGQQTTAGAADENSGQSPAEAIEMLGKLLGKDWDRATLEQAEKAVTEARQEAEG